jgi:hypothetical protein
MPTAFKEWAVICRAMASGRQDVILRKGGIAEPNGSFAVDHRRFLLLPTFLHQSAEQLVPEARDLLEGIDADRPPHGCIVLTHEVQVVHHSRITSLAALAPYRSRHVWSDGTVAERFHRWQNELHILEVAVRPLPEPVTFPWNDGYGGCKSWVTISGDPLPRQH